MGYDDEQDRNRQKPYFIMMPILFGKKEQDSEAEEDHRNNAMMMFLISIIKGYRSYAKGEEDHEGFKCQVMDDIDAKDRKAANHQGKDSTMNCAGH